MRLSCSGAVPYECLCTFLILSRRESLEKLAQLAQLVNRPGTGDSDTGDKRRNIGACSDSVLLSL